MRFLLIVALVLIVFTIIRRLSREHSIGTEPIRPWQQRPPLTFDEFYMQYYSSSGIERSVVQACLQQLGQLLKVPTEQLRPEDRIEDIKPGALDWISGMTRRLSHLPLVPEHLREQLARVDWNILTVDDYIRKLGPLGEHLHGGGGR